MGIYHQTQPPPGATRGVGQPEWAQAHVLDAAGITFADGTTQTTAATGGGTPGGSSNQVQINSSGSFGGIANAASGYVLTSNGVSSAPSFQAPAVGFGQNTTAQNVSLSADLQVQGNSYLAITANASGAIFDSMGATLSETFTPGQRVVVQNVSSYDIYANTEGNTAYTLFSPNPFGTLVGTLLNMRPGEQMEFMWIASSPAESVGQWQIIGYVSNTSIQYNLSALFGGPSAMPPTPATFPPGPQFIRFKFAGGGGAGGNGTSAADSGGGGGGGGGGYSELTISALNLSTCIGSLGAAGARATGAGASGGNGGPTTITLTDNFSNVWVYTASGGTGGSGASGSTGGAGGAGGTGNVANGGAGGTGASTTGGVTTAATTGSASSNFGAGGGGGGGGARNSGVTVVGANGGSNGVVGLTLNTNPIAGGAGGSSAGGGAGTSLFPFWMGGTGVGGSSGKSSGGYPGGVGGQASGGGGGGGITSGSVTVYGANGGAGFIYFEIVG